MAAVRPPDRMTETRAEIRLPTAELRDDLAFFTKVLKMRLDMIYPRTIRKWPCCRAMA